MKDGNLPRMWKSVPGPHVALSLLRKGHFRPYEESAELGLFGVRGYEWP